MVFASTAQIHFAAELYKQFPPLVPFFMACLFVGLPALIFDVWIRPPLLIIDHSIWLIVSEKDNFFI